MSFDSFLEKISDNNKTRNFIIDISDFTSELTEDDYISLLAFIKEKYSSDIVLNEKQQIHYNECVLKETIIKEMEKNKKRIEENVRVTDECDSVSYSIV